MFFYFFFHLSFFILHQLRFFMTLLTHLLNICSQVLFFFLFMKDLFIDFCFRLLIFMHVYHFIPFIFVCCIIFIHFVPLLFVCCIFFVLFFFFSFFFLFFSSLSVSSFSFSCFFFFSCHSFLYAVFCSFISSNSCLSVVVLSFCLRIRSSCSSYVI